MTIATPPVDPTAVAEGNRVFQQGFFWILVIGAPVTIVVIYFFAQLGRLVRRR